MTPRKERNHSGWPRSWWPQVGHFDQKIKVNQIASYSVMLYPRCCILCPCTFLGLRSCDFDSSEGQTRGSPFNFYWGRTLQCGVMYIFNVFVSPKLTFITNCGIGKSKGLYNNTRNKRNVSFNIWKKFEHETSNTQFMLAQIRVAPFHPHNVTSLSQG